ncbi:MAG: ABC transporter ATP-binding protein [Eubacteriales bacterium]
MPVIEAKNLTKSFAGKTVLSNFNISVNQGEVFGLLGSNGAGKTTAIDCILGTKQPDSGTAIILGMDPKTERKKLFEKVGVQFQELHYQDKITVEELCEVTSALYHDVNDYKHLLLEFGLKEKSKSLVSELSGGQKQKLFVLLALIPKANVIFLDELTTGLDTKARRDIWNTLKKLKENGLTVFLVSHFMDEVEALCDTVCILKQGKIVFSGSVQNAIKSSPYKTLEDAYLWYSGEEISE